jgi:copper chaperone
MAKRNIELHVTGMTCQGCVRSVELKLSKVPGVESARVDLAGGTAAIGYDDTLTGADQFIAAVEQIGYHAKA